MQELVRVGKRLKKNNIAVDVISFGETVENAETLQAFHDAVNNDNSSLLSVPTGPHNLSDYLSSFPEVFASGSAGSGGFGEANMGGMGGGIDPNLDPELVAALRMSMEEFESAQPGEVAESAMDLDGEEDALLQEALQMSMAAAAAAAAPAAREEAPVPEPMTFDEEEDDAGLYDDMDEEAQLAMAMSMSMPTEEKPKAEKPIDPVCSHT